MGADLSRVRFDARRDHAGVVMQQGRLLLDADWNELVAILERRLRANVADLAGPEPRPGIAGVAAVSRLTPDAFRIVAGGGSLTIGRGRMYVDGLVAENHGAGADEFEPILAEPRGAVAELPYDEQPYLPEPPALPADGTHLVYLDVWQREVTLLEAPDLVEPAVGVDTTARTQTVWQVRLHPIDGGGVTCSTPDEDVPGWSDVIAPSGARLTVEAIEIDDEDDACAMPPEGGYRGPEHQTYRIEVHDGGQPGTATFTWSRDNGSVASPVVEVLSAGTVVRPASLGKDDVLGFHDGDWVEVVDDHRELAGTPGELRRIEVHDEDGTVTVDPALPGDLQLAAAAAAERHLRIRRWDQHGPIVTSTGSPVVDLDLPTATGAIPIPASAADRIVLERGLAVGFSSTGADFRTGDHWIVAVRAADAAGGTPDDGPYLVEAPPLGIHHHYVRLGLLEPPGDATDCRPEWPECDCEGGGCDCTVCVSPESHESGALTIQMAIDEVREAGGGTVCLGIGMYRLDEGGVVVEEGSSIRVRGQGLRTVLVAPARGIRVERSAFVTVEHLTVFASGVEPAVELRSTAAVTVEDTTVLVLGGRDSAQPGIALSGVALRTSLVGNVVIGPVGIADAAADERLSVLTAELEVRDNLLVCRDVGVGLDRGVGHLAGNRVESNTVLRADDAGIRMLGLVAPAAGVVVADNSVIVAGTGVAVATAGFSVDGNEIAGTAASLERRGDGIAVTPSTLAKLPGAVRIAANRVRDVGGRGIAVLAPVGSLTIASNEVERAQHGIVMDERGRAGSVAVSHNTVTDVGSRPSDAADGTLGIRVTGAGRASVESNTVHGVATAREAQGASVGIDVLACLESRVAGNSVDRVGFAEVGGRDIGIAVRGRIRRCQVDGNTARRQPVDPEEDGQSGFQGLVVGANAHPDEPGADSGGGFVFGTGAFNFAISRFLAVALPRGDASVTVDANIIAGSGELPAALIGVGGDVVVTSNHVHTHIDRETPALRIVARSATVGQNRLRGGRPSGEVDVDPKRIAVLGNLSSTPITNFGGGLEARWAQLNQTGF